MFRYELYESLYEALGELTVRFAILCDHLDKAIYQLISENEDIGEIVLQNMPYSKKVDLWHKLSLLLHDPDEADRIVSLHNKLKAAGRERNNAIHITLGIGITISCDEGVAPSPSYAVRSTRKWSPQEKKMITKSRKATTEEIQAAIRSVDDAYSTFLQHRPKRKGE